MTAKVELMQYNDARGIKQTKLNLATIVSEDLVTRETIFVKYYVSRFYW